MNKSTAITIVKSANNDANDAVINDLLEQSKGNFADGTVAYRPYIVAARTLVINPPNQNLKKLESLEWFDWEKRINQLLETQLLADGFIENIPPSWLAVLSTPMPLSAIVSNQTLP